MFISIFRHIYNKKKKMWTPLQSGTPAEHQGLRQHLIDYIDKNIYLIKCIFINILSLIYTYH